jgi:hypothetical protein
VWARVEIPRVRTPQTECESVEAPEAESVTIKARHALTRMESLTNSVSVRNRDNCGSSADPEEGRKILPRLELSFGSGPTNCLAS